LELEYDRLVKAPAEAVWAALTDTATMEEHLPGEAGIAAVGPEQFRVSMKISMGFLRPTVGVDVRLSDVVHFESFRFEFGGKAMGAGVEGSAGVSVSPDDFSQENPDAVAVASTRVRIAGLVKTSGLLTKISDSKVESAVTSFLDDYFDRVERSV
jgi:carbon monoxide dehydrogenase subunit G